MGLAQRVTTPMTVDEFRSWAARQSGRWELVDGQPVAVRLEQGTLYVEVAERVVGHGHRAGIRHTSILSSMGCSVKITGPSGPTSTFSSRRTVCWSPGWPANGASRARRASSRKWNSHTPVCTNCVRLFLTISVRFPRRSEMLWAPPSASYREVPLTVSSLDSPY